LFLSDNAREAAKRGVRDESAAFGERKLEIRQREDAVLGERLDQGVGSRACPAETLQQERAGRQGSIVPSPPARCQLAARDTWNLSQKAASERRERATRPELAGEAAGEGTCRGVRGAKPLG
jgi:hypothetical protein